MQSPPHEKPVERPSYLRGHDYGTYSFHHFLGHHTLKGEDTSCEQQTDMTKPCWFLSVGLEMNNGNKSYTVSPTTINLPNIKLPMIAKAYREDYYRCSNPLHQRCEPHHARNQLEGHPTYVGMTMELSRASHSWRRGHVMWTTNRYDQRAKLVPLHGARWTMEISLIPYR